MYIAIKYKNSFYVSNMVLEDERRIKLVGEVGGEKYSYQVCNNCFTFHASDDFLANSPLVPAAQETRTNGRIPRFFAVV